MNWGQVAEDHLRQSIRTKEAVIEQCIPDLLRAADALVACFESGNKLMICGNGGSAADSQHLAAEFISTLSTSFQRPPLPAIALTTDTSTLTSRANDFGFDSVFSQQVLALGRAGDCLLSISTSGNSKNCLAAMHAAREREITNLILTGGSGGQMREFADVAVVVPCDRPLHAHLHIQESHLALYHILCFMVERRLNPDLAAEELSRLGS